jgi:RNA polymerase sigma-70 factor (ECF subfamily)
VSDLLQPASAPADPGSTGGAPAHLERVWSEHADAVYRAAYRITGNSADAEDVLQTVFLRLVRRGEGHLQEQAGGYLYRSAVNAGLDTLRRRQRSGWVPLESDARRGALAVAAPDLERDERNRRLRRHLRLALARLSPRAAEIFALRHLEGHGNREIAELLGISVGVVAVLLHRTRARLRKELAALERESHDW